jgi:hypothetical protein
VDDCKDYFRIYFVKRKDQLKTKVVELVERLKQGRFFKFETLGYARENASMKGLIKRSFRHHANILVNCESRKSPHESLFGVKFKKLATWRDLMKWLCGNYKKRRKVNSA